MAQSNFEENSEIEELHIEPTDDMTGDRNKSRYLLYQLKLSMARAKQIEEGCLSLDGVRKTTRYQEIEVEYYDFNWKKQRQKLSGWTAQICQHEIDHLSGKII